MRTETIADKMAAAMLAHNGIAVIWDLYLAAAAARRKSKLEMAASLIEVAEAAERIWAARETVQPT